jgi:hypothetical protein
VHHRWIEYRVLTEFLTSTALLMSVGASPRLPARIQKDHREFSSWIAWYVQAVIRSAGIFRITLDEKTRNASRELLLKYLEEQALAYHEPRSCQNHWIAMRIKRLGTALFAVAVTGCLLQLTNRGEELLGKTAVHVASLIMITCTIWGAALTGFAAQADFSKLALTSTIAREKLLELVRKLDAAGTSGEELREAARNAVDVFLQEHEDWYLFYSLREPDKPT